MNQVQRAHPKPEWEFCLFLDASDKAWSLMLTQIPPDDIEKDVHEQAHEPLAFMSGIFKGSEINWAIIDKEAAPIFISLQRLRHFLIRKNGFRIFTDHRNLSYILDPKTRSNSIPKHVNERLERWAVKLLGKEYVIEHIAGSHNIWADLLTRWASPIQRKVQTFKINAIHGIVSPLIKDSFNWPSLDEIREMQETYMKKELFSIEKEISKDGIHILKDSVSSENPTGIIIIPDGGKNDNLRLRLMIISHCSSAGHRGVQITLNALKSRFFWPNMKDFVEQFCKQCLHCLPHKLSVIPRPFGETLNASKPGVILHFDFLYISLGNNNMKYILVLKDDFSGYISLHCCDSPNSMFTADCIMDWISRYRTPDYFVSDQGTHFKCKLIDELARLLQVNHHFVTAYCPWANGTVERVNRDILTIMKSLLSEFKKLKKEWPDVVPLIQYTINHSSSARLSNESPVTVFTGQPASSPLDFIHSPGNQALISASKLSASDIQTECLKLQNSLDNLHKQVSDSRKKFISKRRRDRKSQSKVQDFKFHIGDFVLVAMPKNMIRTKMDFVWTGPYRIVESVNDYIFKVEHLITHETRDTHVTRMKFYCDKSLNVTEDLLNQIAHDSSGFIVEEIVDIRMENQEFQVLVSWLGFDDLENSWEPLFQFFEQMPRIVREFFQNLSETNERLFSKRKDLLKLALDEFHKRGVSWGVPNGG
jgi:transposase InsO family protein